MLRKLDETELNSWVNSLIGKQTVYGVKARGERFVFDKLSCASELRLDYDVTILPPKKYFLPQQETIIRWSAHNGFESVVESGPFILFGVHPYDAAAIAQMDEVFSRDNEDCHYLARRANATIVALDPQNVSENCFAGCMQTATVQNGVDVILTKIDGGYIVDAKSEKGEALLEDIRGAAEPTEEDLEKRQAIWDGAADRMRNQELRCRPEDLPALLDESYENPLWERNAEKCYSCGSCVLVCPTCYCFDVQDDPNWDLESGVRVRRWDGCMFQDFALVAGGHNFRGDRAARYRHRYYRKGKYLWERIGKIACVGCGRCVSACTTKIANPVEVYNELLEARQ